MAEKYDSSWGLKEKEYRGRSAGRENSSRIPVIRPKRSWYQWLRNNLNFPFPVERIEDEDDAYFGAVGVAFGYFPAKKAANLDPIVALRHE